MPEFRPGAPGASREFPGAYRSGHTPRHPQAGALRQAREKRTLTVVDDQTGSPTYTVDLSRAITGLLEHNSRGIFHVANQGICTWYTFSQAILKFAQVEGVELTPISTEALARPAARPSYSVLDTQKFGQETGMRMRHWTDALMDYLSDA